MSLYESFFELTAPKLAFARYPMAPSHVIHKAAALSHCMTQLDNVWAVPEFSRTPMQAAAMIVMKRVIEKDEDATGMGTCPHVQ